MQRLKKLPEEGFIQVVLGIFLIIIVVIVFVLVKFGTSLKLSDLNLSNLSTAFKGGVIPTTNTASHSASNTASTSQSATSPTQLLINDIKTVFTSAQDKDIITNAILGAQEQDGAKSYADFVKAFQGMAAAYNRDKNPKMRTVMLETRNYLKIYLQYNEADLVVPK